MSAPDTGRYPDESSRQGVWRVLPAVEFEAWLEAQSRVPESIRYIVDHHTYTPSGTAGTPAAFKAQVLGIFRNYYEKPKEKGGQGWGRDRGPQLWLGVIDGEPWVVIATSMWVHGPHAAYFNGCSVGIETMWNGDMREWDEAIYRGLYLIHRAFERRLGIPLKLAVTGPANTNLPTKDGRGWLFHRDARDSNKTCPGRHNSHQALQETFDRYQELEEDEMTKDQEDLLKLSRLSEVARSYDVEALKALLKELIRAAGGNPDVAAGIESAKGEAVASERRRLQL